MAKSSTDAKVNDSKFRQRDMLEAANFFAEIENDSETVSISEELLILQNGTTLDVSGQYGNNIKSSMLANLYNYNVDSDATITQQENSVFKKENFNPFVAKGSFDVDHKEVFIKEEARHSNDGFINDGSKARNRFNNNVDGALKERKDFIKKEISDSNDNFIDDKTEAASGSNNFDFVKEEVNESTQKPESAGVICDMDDSFEKEMSVSEEDVNSSDIEAMFSVGREKKKKMIKKRKKENDEPLECSTCGKTFKLEHNLQKHVLSHLNGDIKPARKFECEICGKKFKKKHHLQRHSLTHTEMKEFACAHCEKCYKDKYDLKKHLASNHVVTECKDCGMRFENHSELRKHQFIHKRSENHETFSVSCQICQKTFLKERYLKRHLQMHAKISPIVCKLCNKSFLYPFLLQEHSRTHTGERPFECDKCDRKFSTKSNLVRHSRTHFKAKTCNNCYSEFENEEQFKEHKKSCTLNYECGKCGLICDRISNIRRHMKIHNKCSNPDSENSADSSIDSENIIVRIV